MASTTASPTATATSVAAAISTAVTVRATAEILARAVAAAAGGIVLRGVVMGSEVLRRGSVGIRLAILGRFGVMIFDGGGLSFFVMVLEKLAFDGVRLLVRIVRLLHRMSVFVMLGGPSQGFTGEQFDRGTIGGRQRGNGGLRLLVRMAVVVVLEIFEDVTNVQESVAIEADIHERGLHTGEDAGDFAFVD